MADHEAPLPRRVYFGAADKQHLAGKQISGGADIHALEIGRRQKLAQTLIQRAEDVASAVKTLRAMDNTGNTEHAINHLQATLQDLTKSHAIFVDDVTESIGRYRDRRDNVQILAECAEAREGKRTALEAIGQQARDASTAARAAGQDWVTVQIPEEQAAAIAAGNVRGYSIGGAGTSAAEVIAVTAAANGVTLPKPAAEYVGAPKPGPRA